MHRQHRQTATAGTTTNTGRTAPSHDAPPPRPTPPAPKATPHGLVIDPHWRVRTDTIDKSGTVTIRYNHPTQKKWLAKQPPARTLRKLQTQQDTFHAGTQVTLLAADLNIRIINRDTGHLIRALTLNPHRDYQPRDVRPGPPKQANTWNDVPRQV